MWDLNWEHMLGFLAIYIFIRMVCDGIDKEIDEKIDRKVNPNKYRLD